MPLKIPVSSLDHQSGGAAALVTLVEYADFADHDSRRMYSLLRDVRRFLRNQLLFVFRHFPAAKHNRQREMQHQAAEYAATENEFWAMHDFCLRQNADSRNPV